MSSADDGRTQQRLDRARSIESTYINDLLGLLEGVVDDGGANDPKMEELIELLEDHLPEEGTLVFSRYTDTLKACLNAFRDNRTGDLDVGYGLYTGQEAWIATGGTRTPATKRDVKSALEDEEIRVVFCSEAAAEGLNLQAARVMINIDVPWNPAKLEQRIGRIARLGQAADEVVIYNLWYPDSVEAKMYTRLTERKDLYDVAVGKSPEIVSDAIRSRIASRGGTSGRNLEDAIEKLGDIRRNMQHAAISEVWGPLEDSVPLSTKVRRDLLEAISVTVSDATLETDLESCRVSVERPGNEPVVASSEPEDRSILTLHHEIIDLLGNERGLLPAAVTLHVVEIPQSGTPLGICLEREGKIAAVPPEKLPALLAFLIDDRETGEVIDEDTWISKDEVNLLKAVRASTKWLPDHGKLAIPSDADRQTSGMLLGDGVELRLRPF